MSKSICPKACLCASSIIGAAGKADFSSDAVGGAAQKQKPQPDEPNERVVRSERLARRAGKFSEKKKALCMHRFFSRRGHSFVRI